MELRIVKQDATVEKTAEEQSTGSGEGFFVVARPIEIGYVTSTPSVVALTFQLGVGYAF